ncbi:glycosyltransferase family 4 protein [Streptomyces sp. NPDC006339]|uniref:glycosyltransferase family 4 protein n=1 Tax=Streptomyces sp. NPDC006339 TaxID=3156755 RepID=UPI0033ADA1B1
MNIVALVHFAVPFRNAGSETMLHALLKPLAAAGHDVTVVTTDTPQAPHHYQWDGIKGLSRPGARAAAEAVRELAPDVVVTQHQNTALALDLARETGAKSVFLMHNDFELNGELLAREPDLVVFNTDWIAAKYADQAPRSLVVHPPVWAEQHATTPGDCITLVNLNRDKGAAHLYYLARRMPEQQFLGVIGAHGKQVRVGGDNVEIVEHTTDMRADVWARTRILIMPSVYESYGMVGIEAMASGIPVVAAPTPGLVESLGDAGTFVERDDLDAWETALRGLLDPKAYKAASARALKRSAQLDPTAELAAWVTAVEEVSGHARPRRRSRPRSTPRKAADA